MSKQAKKKEKIFRDTDKPVMKRLKALHDYLGILKSEEAIGNFFLKNYDEVFDMICQAFLPATQTIKKKKPKALSSSDAKIAFDVFELFIHHSKSTLRGNWNIQKILKLFSTVCSISNKQSVRDRGIKLLCSYIDILQDSIDSSVVNLFRDAFDLSPFIDEFSKTVFLSSKPLNTPVPGVDGKDRVGGSKKDLLRNIEYVLNFVVEKATNKTFWIRLIVATLFQHTHPDVCIKLGIIETDTGAGFREYCPYELEVLFVKYIIKWMGIASVNEPESTRVSGSFSRPGQLSNTVFLESLMFDEFRDIFLAVFDQAFTLPIEYEETLNSVLSLYKSWIQQKKVRPPSIRREFNVFLTAFAYQVERGFMNIPAGKKPALYIPRLKNFLQFLEIIISEKQDFLTQKYWELLIDFSVNALLAVATHYPTQIKDEIFPRLLGVSFSIWINSKSSNRSVWRNITRVTKMLRDDMVMSVQWKRLLIMFTHKVHRYLFNTDDIIISPQEQEHLSPPNKIPLVYWKENGRNSPTFVIRDNHRELPSFEKFEKAIPRFQLRDNFWTQETATFIWNRIFRLFGNPNNIQNPQVYSYVISTYIELFNLLKIIEENLLKKAGIPEQTYFPFHNLFTPIFFEGALSDSIHGVGRALCFGILCQMLSRVHKNSLSAEILSRFYYTITVGLKYKDPAVTANIVRYTSQLFGYAYPGINGLIGPYIWGIKDFLNTPSNPYLNPTIYTHIVTILSQFIAIQDHFYGMEIYDYSKILNVDTENVNVFVEVQNSFGNEIETRENVAIEFMKAVEQQVAFDKLLEFAGQEYQRRMATAASDEKIVMLRENYLIDLESIRISIAKIISDYLARSNPKDVDSIRYSIWLLTSTLLVELERGQGADPAIAKIVLKTIFKYVDNPNPKVSSAASTSLSNISNKKVIYTVEKDTCDYILKSAADLVVRSISDTIQSGSSLPGYLHTVIQFIVSWTVKLPGILKEKYLTDSIFRMIFTSLNLVTIKSGGKKMEIGTLEALLLGSEKGKKKKAVEASVKTLGEMILKTKKLYRAFEIKNIGQNVVYDPPVETHPYIELMNSAEILYHYLNTTVNNYPRFGDRHDHISSLFESDAADLPPEYMKITNGYILGEEPREVNIEEYSRTYALNESTLITVHELVKPGIGRNPVIRVIVRDVSGKYVWDVEFLTDKIEDARITEVVGASGSSDTAGERVSIMDYETILKKREVLPPYSREANVVPKYDSSRSMDSVDLLSEVLSYVGEYINDGSRFDVPSIGDYKNHADLVSTEELFLETEEVVRRTMKDSQRLLLELMKEPGQNIPIHRVQYVRTLLTAIGLIRPDQTTRFVPLTRLAKVTRAIKQIDKRQTRELQKIGVLYIAAGQKDQRQILHNEAASPIFEEFVDSLGWNVDISSHKGYIGGLDKYAYVNGRTFPYYSEFDLEVVFHVVSRMPNSETDEQQIHKKKHVGNDNIHIVWSEDSEEYRKETITSQFNFAHVVIYPLPNGMFRIQILCKDGVELFGPCISGMILDKRSLGFMVRETAITANKTVRYSQVGYKHPFPTRWDIINETVERNTDKLGYEEYFGDFFYLDEGQR